MSSNIPTRRVTRTTRLTVAKDKVDNENANARPSRIATRARPAATAAATNNSATSGISRATAATAASRAKADSKLDPAAGKRKREALGEVTGLVTNNRTRASAANNTLKGKEKDTTKDAIDVAKPKATTVAARQPLRTVAAPATRRATRSTQIALQQQRIEEIKEQTPEDEEPDENAMVVDEPVVSTHTRRSAKRKSGASVRAVPVEPPEPTHAEANRRISTRVVVAPPEPEEDDAEINRVYKKRRTSSEAPEEAEVQPQDESEAAADRVAAELEAYLHDSPEAQPDGDQWVDLDEEDADDPLMVSEYVVDIFEYYKEIELTTMPNPNYMESQKELAWKMRGILSDWLIQVHVRFRLLPETLFLCVNIIDRFLSARVVSLAKLQLVGITSMFIAAKFEEIVAPSVKHFLRCADASYTESEILQAERYVLKTLDWNLSYPNPVHYLRRVSKADEYDVKVRTVAKYLLEIGCVEWRLIAAPPSLMAAASLWLARLVLGRGSWTPNLAHYSSYAESALIPTANLMLNYILKPIRHESFYKKYAGRRFYKSSVYLRAWAIERWSENAQVSLADELPYLKAENRLAQDRVRNPLLPPHAGQTGDASEEQP